MDQVDKYFQEDPSRKKISVVVVECYYLIVEGVPCNIWISEEVAIVVVVVFVEDNTSEEEMPAAAVVARVGCMDSHMDIPHILCSHYVLMTCHHHDQLQLQKSTSVEKEKLLL